MDYISVNKKSWNKRAEEHFKSDFYDNSSFIGGRNSLNEIELEYLSDLKSKRILHLMCHFGQDSISMARMGADVTAVDFSEKAISLGKKLSESCNTPVNFICSDVFSLKEKLNNKFDIVFASYGTIGWLPDINKWSEIVGHFLNPGGKFVFAEFHPFIWTMDYKMKSIAYDYFNSDPIIEESVKTYTDTQKDLSVSNISWNHGLSEVIMGLINQNFEILSFNEYDYSPYSCFDNLEKISDGKYRFKHIKYSIPMVYSINAVKKE